MNWKRFSLAVFVCVIDSGFTHGYHFTNFLSLRKPLEDWLHSKGYSEGGPFGNNRNSPTVSFFYILNASFFLGATFGSCLIVRFANQFGRKGGMLMTTFISVFASLFVGYSKYFESPISLFIGRFLFGVKVGINSGLAPMYLVEISPQEMRGTVGMTYGVMVSVGSVVGKAVATNLGNDHHWPLVQSIAIIPAIVQLIWLPNCPESPKYLRVMKNNELECRKALKWLRGDGYNEEELDKLRVEYYQRQTIGDIRLGFIINNIILRGALIASTVLVMSQQLCGMSMLVIYVESHLRLTSSDAVSRHKNLDNVFHVSKAIAAICFLFIIEKYSRRKLLLVSFGGMVVTSFLICAVFLSPNFSPKDIVNVLAVLYIMSYKLGPGAISWFTPSEYFNTSAAPIAYSIGVGGNWLLMFCLYCYAVPFSKLLKGYSFLNYIVTNCALFYFTYAKLPDTRNKSLKEIYRSMYYMHKNS